MSLFPKDFFENGPPGASSHNVFICTALANYIRLSCQLVLSSSAMSALLSVMCIFSWSSLWVLTLGLGGLLWCHSCSCTWELPCCETERCHMHMRGLLYTNTDRQREAIGSSVIKILSVRYFYFLSWIPLQGLALAQCSLLCWKKFLFPKKETTSSLKCIFYFRNPSSC